MSGEKNLFNTGSDNNTSAKVAFLHPSKVHVIGYIAALKEVYN